MRRLRRSQVPLDAAHVVMGKLRDHRRMRRVAVAVLAVCVLWTAVAWYLDQPDIHVEHTVRGSAPEPLSDVGPPAGGFRQAWRVTVPAPEYGQPAAPLLVGGHAVVPTHDDVKAYDARTGRLGWHYREPGGKLDTLVATDDAVVAAFRNVGEDNYYSHLVGLDAGTGERLWEDDRISLWSDRTVAPQAGVVMARDDDDWLGIDARSGDERWRLTRSDVTDRSCRPSVDGADAGGRRGDVVAVTFSCDELGSAPDVLAVVDAASGEPLWARTEKGSTQWAASRGVVLYQRDEEAPLMLLARTGKPLFTAPEGALCLDATDCLTAAGNQVILRYRTEQGSKLTTVDPRTGEATTRFEPGIGPFQDLDASLATAGDRIYVQTPGLSPAASQVLLPAGLAVVDARSGRVDHASMPFGNRSFDEDRDDPAPEQLAGVAGGRLFGIRPAASRGRDEVELAAYESTGVRPPVELGGTSMRDWPDACTLLRGAPGTGDDRPHVEKPIRVGDSTLRRWSCDAGESTVQVRWVATTAAQAAVMLGGGKRSRVGADEERVAGNGIRLLRVGRVVVSVHTYDTTDDERDEVARAVVENLRDDGP